MWQPGHVILWQTHANISSRPAPKDDNLSTSWRANKLARSSTRLTTASLKQGNCVSVYTRAPSASNCSEKTHWITYETRISPVCRVSSCPWHQLLSGCAGIVWEECGSAQAAITSTAPAPAAEARRRLRGNSWGSWSRCITAVSPFASVALTWFKTVAGQCRQSANLIITYIYY